MLLSVIRCDMDKTQDEGRHWHGTDGPANAIVNPSFQARGRVVVFFLPALCFHKHRNQSIWSNNRILWQQQYLLFRPSTRAKYKIRKVSSEKKIVKNYFKSETQCYQSIYSSNKMCQQQYLHFQLFPYIANQTWKWNFRHANIWR